MGRVHKSGLPELESHKLLLPATSQGTTLITYHVMYMHGQPQSHGMIAILFWVGIRVALTCGSQHNFVGGLHSI